VIDAPTERRGGRHADCSLAVVPTRLFRLRLPGVALTCAILVLCLAGCDRVDHRAIPGDSIRSGWASPERPSTLSRAFAQRDFLTEAAQSNLFEIEASRVALDHGGSPAVRRYAESTLRDRVAIDTDLAQLAASVGVVLPSRLNDNLRARLAVLEQLAGSDFDRAYARNVGVLVQEEALAVFERTADRNGERVQRFAADRIPALRKHLESGRRLASALDKSDMA
jgi:putative membrane protein